MRTWSAAQLLTFLTVTREHRHAAAFYFLATTGVRRGEALGLGWSQVNLEEAWARVVPGRVLADALGGEPIWSSPKTDRGRRSIALDAGTVAVLRALKATQAAEKLRLGPAYRGASDQMHQFGVEIPNHWRPVMRDPFAARGCSQGAADGLGRGLLVERHGGPCRVRGARHRV